jgi:charged multivesicular body protein 7
MKLSFILALSLGFIAMSSADQKWFNLRTTWMFNPLDSLAFAPQPRTVAEAEGEGWIELDNQCDVAGAKFAGRRFVRSASDIQMVLLFDINGFIAGVQSPVPVANTYNNQYFDYDASAAYNLDVISGVDAYVTTIYFVEPSIICSTGRTQEEYDVDGTGNGLWFQNGADYSAENLVVAPLTEDAAVAEGRWYKHFCFLNMGNHFFEYDHTPDQDCGKIFPAQLVYEDNNLKGFVWQHVADMEGDRWEKPDGLAIGAIVDRPPSCPIPLTETPGLRTMHFYLVDYTDLCVI